MNASTKIVRATLRVACFSLIAIAGVAQAQVLGGNVVGGAGGMLSGGARGVDGSFGGGFAGAGRIDNDAFGRTRSLSRHTLDRTQSSAARIEGSARDGVSDGKHAAWRGKGAAEGNVGAATEHASNAAKVSNEFAGSAASNARSSGANAAADGAFLSTSEANRRDIASGGALAQDASANRSGLDVAHSADSFGSVSSAKKSNDSADAREQHSRGFAPTIDASGDASADAHARRSKHGMPRANASASADGDASVSR